MEEIKRTCSNCGARLRPGARFCSACGSIVRVAPKTEEPQHDVNPTPQEPEKTPIRGPRGEGNSRPKELYYYEKTDKKSKESKRETPKRETPKREAPKKTRVEKETLCFDLAGDKIHLWNALTAVTSLIPLVLGIVLLCVNFMSVTYEGFKMSLSMNDCFDVLFNRDFPIFYEVTTEIAGMCSAVGIAALVYLIGSIAHVGYNLVMYGRYDKTVLLINTICSAVLTAIAGALVVFYMVMMNKCNAIAGVGNFQTFVILFAILTAIVLILDVVKYTILYQKKAAALNRPSYVLNFISSLGKKIWKLMAIIGGSLAGVALIVVVLLATAKSPTIKVWEEYVDAYNAQNATAISECYYPLTYKENANIQNIYKELFASEGKTVITKGQAVLELRTEKYVTIKVVDATIQKEGEKATKLGTLKLHFGNVGSEWYLMSKVDLANGGNKVSINEFNQEVSSTILKINDNILRGFSLKLSSKDAKEITELVVPNGITKIEEGSFKGLTNLKTVVLPNSVTEVEAEAFAGCTSLETVKLGNKLAVLGASVFEGCESLEEIVLPEALGTVGKNTFKDCSNLTIYTYFNKTMPSGYDAEWNASNCKVYYGDQWGHDETNPERINLLTIVANGGSYELDSDEYYEDGQVATLPTPTKLGCGFIGWYTTPDFQESSKVTSGSITMNSDVTVYAKWEENVYNIEYDLAGGTLSDMVTVYTITDEITLGMPVKEGYTFIGWLGTDLGDEPVENVVIKNATGHRKYTAVYAANMYKITLNANGGMGTGVIEVKYGEKVRLTNAGGINWGGMNLTGWNTEADGSGTSYKINQEIEYTETANITLYAQWASLITLNPGEKAKVEGELPRITKGQTNYKLPVPTTDEYVFFMGWYVGEQQITNEQGVGLGRWEFDTEVTLKAKWSDTMTKDGFLYFYRGVYPQSRVTDEKIISALTKKVTTDSRGYYELNGSYYAKVKFNDASAVAYFNDGTRVLYGNTYYFKVEKVLWRVLDIKTNVVISEYVLDAMPFYDNNQDRSYDDPKAGITVKVYPNDFSESNIHKFLNDMKLNRYNLANELQEIDYENKGFLTSTFGITNKTDSTATAENALKYIQYQLTVDNTEASTLVPGNPFSTYDTAGYFFPLSHKEFKETYALNLAGGKAYATDYAIAREVECERTDKATPKAATYWLRSPYYDSSKEALYVNIKGTVDHILVNNNKIGLRPACVLNMETEEAE